MSIWDKIFKKRKSILPCQKTGECPFEYDKDSDRDVEGMPFVENDPRSCPEYGHICPEFMEDFELTVDDLNIRATIHCASVMLHLVEKGEVDENSQEYKELMTRYKEIAEKYPIEKYPQYYDV
jgi:hypothetical protein